MHRALGSGGDRAAAAAAEPRGFAGGRGRGVRGEAGRYWAGPEPQLWSRSLAAAPFLRAAPGSGRVLPGLGDLSTWRCSKVVGGSSGPSYFFLGGGVGCEILAVANLRSPNVAKI